MTFNPDWASPPGDTIKDVLNARHMSISDLAEQTGSNPDAIEKLIDGRSTITIALARHLAQALGCSSEFWMSRDYQYRQHEGKVRGASADWLSQIPMSDLVRFGWLTPSPHPAAEVNACLRFFDVPSVHVWHAKYDAILDSVNFRTSPSFDSWPAATAAWLRQGEIETARIKCASWNPEGFHRALSEARRFTRIKQPRIFLPKLQQLSAAHGVAVGVVRAPAGCRASGATRFQSDRKALLLLSVRHLTDDHFWYSFFHEAAHVLLHGNTRWILESPNLEVNDRERQANEFAEKILLPAHFRRDFSRLRGNSRDVIRFARRAGISPGIVVGQLQHRGHIEHSHLNRLKRRYKWQKVSLEMA